MIRHRGSHLHLKAEQKPSQKEKSENGGVLVSGRFRDRCVVDKSFAHRHGNRRGLLRRMTGDYDPLHTDHEFAAKSHYGKPIAHGLLGLSLMAGLSSTTPRLRNFGFDQSRFLGVSSTDLRRRYDLRG